MIASSPRPACGCATGGRCDGCLCLHGSRTPHNDSTVQTWAHRGPGRVVRSPPATAPISPAGVLLCRGRRDNHQGPQENTDVPDRRMRWFSVKPTSSQRSREIVCASAMSLPLVLAVVDELAGIDGKLGIVCMCRPVESSSVPTRFAS
jgi:hypothetical protein